jgi:ankyrin repeat protein
MADTATAFEQVDAAYEMIEAAARQNDVPKLKRMAASGIDLDVKGDLGETALISLCSEGRIDAVRALLEAGADSNATSNLGMTPLGQALGLQFPDIAELLLKHGADPDQLVDVNIAPLTIAISSGDARMTGLLLEHKASLTLREPCSDPPPIIQTAEEGNLDILRLLHEEYGADINLVFEEYGQTALMSAIEKSQDACFDYLLEKGANLGVLNKEDKSLLHIAACADNVHAIEELLKRGFDVEQCAPGPRTPLLLAACDGCGKAVRALLDHGADMAAEATDGNTARMLAEKNGHKNIVELLDETQHKRHLAAVDKDVQIAHNGIAAAITVPGRLRLMKRRG